MRPILPAWMYADPAVVAERLELQAQAKLQRQIRRRERPEEKGLTPGVVRIMRRLRIKELMRQVLEGRR